MAWTSVGFDGTITEIQWAGLAGLLGNGYVAAGNGDCLVTAVGGARQVSVAAGSLYGDGVVSTNSGAETVSLTTPVNGQWYVVALRRTWASNTAALVAIAGATTTTSTPTAPPTSFPVLNDDPGVLTDQPIAWAWCNSANTTVVVYDIRLKAVKSLPPVVANQNERDAKFMSPTQGLQVFRNDLGATETWFDAYHVSTNPGGRTTAGWYQEPIGQVLQVKQVSRTDAFALSIGGGSFGNVISTTFTPKSATSKILFNVSVPWNMYGSSGSVYGAILRNSSTWVTVGDARGSRPSATGGQSGGNDYANEVSSLTFSSMDTPNTTSSITYDFLISHSSGVTQSIYVNRTGNDGNSYRWASLATTVTIMEISA